MIDCIRLMAASHTAVRATLLLGILLSGHPVTTGDAALRITTMDEDVAACGTADDDCLANVAADWSDAEPCERARNRLGCLDKTETKYFSDCDRRAPDERETCYFLMASELGSTGACEKLPVAARDECYGAASALRRDPRIIETRIPSGPQRDLALSTYAVVNLDETVLERIERNEAYDGAKTALVMPLAIRGKRLVPDDYCERLRGQYQGDYPEDAAIAKQTCEQAVAMARHYSSLESEDQREAFLTSLVKQVEQMERENQDNDAEGSSELQRVPDDALVFYTGQKNELTVSVWNGSDTEVTGLTMETRGDGLWLSVGGISPGDLRIPPVEKRDVTLSFRIAANAPDGATQKLSIRAGGSRENSERLTVSEFTIEIRRRAVAVSARLEAAGD